MTEVVDIDLHQKKEIEIHKKLSDYYCRKYSFAFSKIYQCYWNEEILKMFPTDRNIKILDLGCGTGLLLVDLVDKFKFVIGLDISAEMLKELKDSTTYIKGLVNATGNRLPFLQDSFDVVVCRGSLHHIRFLNETLSEIKRVLKKEGLLIFSEPSNDCILIRVTRILMYKISKKFNENDKAFLTKELRSILLQNGFDILKEKRFGFFSYLLCGFPVHFALMCYVPFNVKLSIFFKKIDMLLTKVQFIKNQSFHIIIKAKKEDRNDVF